MDENKVYSVTLSDGTVISGLHMNGNNFISDAPLTNDIFEGNCAPIVINDGDKDIEHNYMELVHLREEDGQYWFVLRDVPASELRRMKMESDIEYVAMMAGIEL